MIGSLAAQAMRATIKSTRSKLGLCPSSASLRWSIAATIGRTTRRMASSCLSRAGVYRPRQYHCRPTSREPPVPRLDARAAAALRAPCSALAKRRDCVRHQQTPYDGADGASGL
eukprot:3233271-Prymnesium_polylepis.2